ncbi:MAG: YceI family protein [Bacteroidota bacterium]
MKNKFVAILSFILMLSFQIQGQKYFSKTGDISFSSKTPLEDIEAESHTASTVIDLESGKIQWAVLIKSFEFEKALMQEHFNENYMESNKYPKAKFAGTIEDVEKLDFSNDGSTVVVVNGKLNIHGETQNISTNATFSITSGKITGMSELKIAVADYNIEIPSVVKDNIAKEITIKIKAHYEALN